MEKSKPRIKRGWPMSYIGLPREPNPVWVLEYAETHGLTLEVAIEHLAVYLDTLSKDLANMSKELSASNAELVNPILEFAKYYKPVPYSFTPIPLVNVLAKDTSKKKKS